MDVLMVCSLSLKRGISTTAKFFFCPYRCSLAKHFDWESQNAEKVYTMELQMD